MRYRLFSFLLITFIISSCSFQFQVITPETPIDIVDMVTPTNTATPIIQILSFTETPAPPPTFTFTPETPPLQPASGGVSTIQFAPGGTYVDVIDSLVGGSSKTYSIAASQGQVMSVSVMVNPIKNDWTVIPMRIIGADGQALCEVQQNKSCYFWRGILPVTQQYFLTLSPEVDITDFTIRVAIDPPGTVNQSFQYTSRDGHVSFIYTDEFAPAYPPPFQVARDEPEIVLAYIDTQAFDNTNLYEAYILFNASMDGAIVQTCTQPVSMGGPEQIVGEVNINGVSFTHSEGGGVATGNFYEQSIYRTVQHNTCYEMILVVHSFSTGALMPQIVIDEYDRNALFQKFESILSSLVIR